MKYTRIAALAAVGVAATLSLTACGGDGSGKDTSAKDTSAANVSSSSADSGAQTEGGSGSGSSQAPSDAKPGSGDGKTGSGNAKPDSGDNTKAGAGAGGGAGTGGGAAQTSGKITFCKTANLAIDARNAAPDASSGRINITMVNRGSTTCSATGFAGVDIKDADHTSNPIERGHAEPRITTLKPGDTAIFDLAYDIDTTGKSLTSPTNLLVTPPNETHTVTLDWPAGAGQIKGAYTDVQVFPTHTTE
ncbi:MULTISPECIES: DUF4232 domain-containing protein [unclassified Streptomyces]|uniref:DUF4232 domain-containing protein n=1 Tax=unclassified Streptomyces TaxID=2593676 RepID=UPI0007F9EFEA|nr:DUF4232 domain-containing protein [Streptomyces sp. SAT1]ANO42017.1 hypothetical protein A8713_032665 [Streptomyces sp. SAT1]